MESGNACSTTTCVVQRALYNQLVMHLPTLKCTRYTECNGVNEVNTWYCVIYQRLNLRVRRILGEAKSTGGKGETTICALVMICLTLLYFPPQIGRPRGSVGSSGTRLVLKGGSSHRICPKLRALVRGRLATGGYCASEDRETEGYSSRLRLDFVFKASQQIRQVHSATRSHALLWCITKKGTMRNPASGKGSGVEWWDGWAWRVVQALAQSFSSRAGTTIACS